MADKDFPSIGVRKNDLTKPIYNTLVEIAMKVSQKKFATSQEDIALIRSARDEAIQTVTSHFGAMLDAAELRRENLAQYKDIRFISMGNDGFIDNLLTRWGLKAPSNAVEDIGPFDSRDCSARFVGTAIANSFKDYVAACVGIAQDQRAGNGRLTVLQTNPSISDGVVSSAAASLYERYVDNFRRWIASNTPAVIIYHSGDAESETQQAVQFIFNSLLRSREGRKTVCMWIYTPDPGAADVEWTTSIDHLILQAPYPINEYTWNLPVHLFSGRGQAFEKNLVTGIKNLLREEDLPALVIPSK